MFTVISYDIRDDQRRDRVASILKDYGARVQYSVFEADITKEQVEELRAAIEQIIAPEDQVRYYRLCGACEKNVELLGGVPVSVLDDIIEL